ncbi:hypothetical protein AVEN_18231-1 [Araneus ventricosus]|uniref:Paired domain-containing protein n=1 Tax=Araneus ventricosus TaxID=182803 RepID=A0A4Y2AIL2_ARAVE|nr:hypothetical protein AVEN_18231-1 [Araneus ventricosus]
MSSQYHSDHFSVGVFIVKLEERRKITDVARVFDIAQSVVSRLWKAFETTGICSKCHGGGRLRSTASAGDRYIEKKPSHHSSACLGEERLYPRITIVCVIVQTEPYR